MPFSAAGGGVESEGEGGGRLRWGRRERSLIIRDRPRGCGGPGEERPQKAGGARRSGTAGRGCRARSALPPALRPSSCRSPAALVPSFFLPRIAHLRRCAARAVRGAVTLGGAGGWAEQRAGSRCFPIAQRSGGRTGGIGPWQPFQRRRRAAPCRLPSAGAAVGRAGPEGQLLPECACRWSCLEAFLCLALSSFRYGNDIVT
ncbi:uncharacterized protein [Sylvia atricapilla]|uniref:uncharacterized protein n=1 Tax=Sylvia atricapilla TaxID=48155 RepID=UPI003395F519